MIAQNHEGQALAAMSKKLWVPLGPLEVEAKAMEESIIFTRDMGLQEVIFECNSELVFWVLNGTSTPLLAISNIISACLIRLQDFRAVQFSHVRCQGNRPTHILAQFAKNLDSFVTWIEETPNIIKAAMA